MSVMSHGCGAVNSHLVDFAASGFFGMQKQFFLTATVTCSVIVNCCQTL